MVKFFRFGERKIESDPFWKQELTSSHILLPFKSKSSAMDFYNECLLVQHDKYILIDLETSNDKIVCVKIHGASKELRDAAQDTIMEIYSNVE